MVMTPLGAPDALNTRSIVFPAGDSIAVEIGPGRDGKKRNRGWLLLTAELPV